MRDGSKREIRLFLGLLLFSFLLVFFDRIGVTRPIRGIFEKPIIGLEREVFLSYERLARPIRSLKQEDKEKQIFQLEEKLRQLAVDQNKLNSCQEENERLRKLLGAPLPPKWKFMVARTTGIVENQMGIDKGEKEGVKENMIVISENILVGKVTAIKQGSATVQLVNNVNSRIPVVVKKSGGQGIQGRGLLLGQPDGRLILDRVLQAEDIRKDDLVVTNGEEGWPPELVIGQISEVLGNKVDVYKKAKVVPLANYRDLRIVFLIISS